jgi:anaerobic magnesium-protoporphyrin IX monomethyl ester cyclase
VLRAALENSRFGIMGISALTSEMNNACKVARLSKELHPDIPVVIGGYHASALPEATLSAVPEFDYLLHGEGEQSFTNFIRKVRAGEDPATLRGLAYRTGEGVHVNPPEALIADLNELPLTARDKIDMRRYQPKPATGNFMKLPSTGIMASRGCPFECAFCSKGVWHRSIRFRSPENVVQEIEHCIDRYGTYDFRFYDDALTSPSWDFNKFCRILLDKGLRICWNCYSRVDHVNEEKLRLMKATGCYHIKYGVEFGTDKALQLAHKNITTDLARRAIDLTKKAGIECKASFIFGIPGETVEDCKKTLQFAIELSPDLASFYPFDLFPGSLFYQQAQQDMKAYQAKTLPREVAEGLTRKAYYRFYLRPQYIWQRSRRLLRYPRREARVVSNGLRMMGAFLTKSLPKK